MKAIQAYPPQGLDGLALANLPTRGEPGPTVIRVRAHAASLHLHSIGVVAGRLPFIDRCVPMADGGGMVEAVGSEVTAR